MAALPGRFGPHEVVCELASGGMAVTYVGRKTGARGFERLVVIKRVHPHLCEGREHRDMLRDEARMAALVQHPNVVPVEDVIEASGELCLVMPYVESLSLAALIEAAARAGERLAPAVSCRILLDVLAGLHAAHEATDLRGLPLAIVHRDVSPRNVLVGTDGQARLIDFGIAKAARRVTTTKSGILKGTVAYMAPEALRRREVDRRADVFAAGALLFEALTGRRLFEGEDEADVLIGVLADEIPPIAPDTPGVPAEVDSVLERALARDRDERFPTAAALAEALERALPPAPAREVAEAALRWGSGEVERRREAIKVFLERTPKTRQEKPPRTREALVVSVAAALAVSSAIAIGSGFAEPPPPLPAPSMAQPVARSAPLPSASMPAPSARAPEVLRAMDPPERAPRPIEQAAPRAGASAPARPVRGKAGGELHENPYR
jgi:serine/threonine-protein kinase